MKVNFMRALDRFLGVPLCWLYGIIPSRSPASNDGREGQGVRNILVIKFFGMGSILLSTPALSLIKQSFPAARVTFLSFETNRELLERIPVVDDVLTIDSSSVMRFIMDAVKVLRASRLYKYEIVFDFEFFSKFSTLVSRMTNAPIRVGFALPTVWRSLLLTHQTPVAKELHVIEAFCGQVFQLTGKKPIPQILSPRALPRDRDSLLGKAPLNGRQIIAINVNAGETFRERRWEPEKFAELASRIAQTNGCDFYFIGAASERQYVQRIIDMTSCRKRCYNLAGVLNIPELTVLLQQCELLVSNDSGPLHLAAAVGARAIGLYGPESPAFYGPVSNHVATIYKGVSCSPCMNIYTAKSFRCPYNAKCMQAIDVREVELAVEESYSTH